MRKHSLAEQYKQFMKKQNIDGMDSQREADIHFLQCMLPNMKYPPDRLAQVIQKYSLNRAISHYGKKLVKEISRQPQVLANKEKLLNQMYPRNRFAKHAEM